MVQDFVLAAYRWLLSAGQILLDLFPYLALTTIALGTLWIALRKFDPETARSVMERLLQNRGRLRDLLFLTLAVLLLCGGLVQARKSVRYRQATIDEAPASRRYVPELGGVVQYAPRVAVLEERTYTRRLTVPPYYVERLGTEGLQVLSPYLSDPSSENVTRLVDSFKRSGRDVVFTRELTRIDEVPIAADVADVKVTFDHRGAASGRRHYEVVFDAEYRFRNPKAEAAEMRMKFPLPEGGGTMQGFYLQSEGTRITEPDERGEYAWQGTVSPSQTVTVKAHYAITGSRAYFYNLGSERRRIGDFHMVAVSPESPRYEKSALYPTNISGDSSEWRLKDVITVQSIALRFPSLDIGAEILDKTLSSLPIILLAFGLAALLAVPARALWGTLAFGTGLLGVAVLSAYASPQSATLIGATAAVLLSALALRNLRGLLIALIGGVATLVFLSVEHGALIGWCIAIAILVITLAVNSRYRTIQT